MCTAAEIVYIKRRLELVETQIQGIHYDLASYKRMVDDHLKKDKSRTIEFRKREDFLLIRL